MDRRHTIREVRERPNAVLFDWDNTLMDHDEHTMPIVDKLVRKLGKPPYPDAQEVSRVWARSPEKCSELYFGNTPPRKVTKIFHRYVEEHRPDNFKLLPSARDVLDDLKARHIPMAVVSNKPEARLKKEIGQLGLTDYFEVIRGDRGNSPLKPDPHPLIETIKEMGLALENLWFVGDMYDDIEASRSHGFQRFLVGDRHREKIQALSYGSDPAGKVICLDSIALFREFTAAIPHAGNDRSNDRNVMR